MGLLNKRRMREAEEASLDLIRRLTEKACNADKRPEGKSSESVSDRNTNTVASVVCQVLPQWTFDPKVNALCRGGVQPIHLSDHTTARDVINAVVVRELRAKFPDLSPRDRAVVLRKADRNPSFKARQSGSRRAILEKRNELAAEGEKLARWFYRIGRFGDPDVSLGFPDETVVERFNRWMSSKTGKIQAKNVVRNFNAARSEFPIAPESAVLIQTMSRLPFWSVELGGALVYKNQKTGHVVDDKMTLPELVYIVICVEIAARLGRAARHSLANAVMEGNEYLASLGLDEEWRFGFDLPKNVPRWAGTYWGRVLGY